MTAPPPDPPGRRASDGTNGWAVAAFVLGILGGTILSVIFAIVALVQIRRRDQRGRGLAIAALFVSALWIAMIASVIGYAVSVRGTSVQSTDLRTGDCVKDAYGSRLPTWVSKVRCDRPHDGEVFAVLTRPDTAAYPSTQALADDCGAQFFGYAPNPPSGPVFRVSVAYPSADAWANGERAVVCVAVSPREQSSSLRR